MLNKAELLAISLKTKEVKLESGTVTIREFTTSDREAFEMLAMKMSKDNNSKNMKASVIVKSIINKEGTRVFGDDENGLISQMPSTITQKIFNEILEINGMAGDALDVETGN